MGRLNSMLLNNQWITEELKRRNQNVLGDKLKKKKQLFKLYVMQQMSFKREVYSQYKLTSGNKKNLK